MESTADRLHRRSGMQLTADQVLALAPDASSAAAGRKLASAKGWQGPGRDPAALWGECQGSALYQVRVDLADLTAKCSCPSRKFPCKHALGLLLLAAAGEVRSADEVDWVKTWVDQRVARADQPERKPGEVADPIAAQQRAARRADRVSSGMAE